MTIAALLFADTFPTVITDSMISSLSGERKSVITPLLSNESREGYDNHFPVGVARKIWRVGVESILLYSGRVDHAKELRGYLELLTSYQSFDDSTLNRLCTFVDIKNLQVSFIVLSKDGGEVRYDSSCKTKVTHDYISTYGKVLIIGTGAESFYNILKKVKPLTLPNNPQENPSQYIANALLNGLLAAAEMTTDYLNAKQSTFANNSCGAYFEVRSLINDFFTEYQGFISDGTGHLFFTVENNVATLRRVVLSRPSDEENRILSANGELARIVDNERVSISKKHFKKHSVKDYKDDSAVIDIHAEDRVESFAISQLTLYAEVHNHQCGHYFNTSNCNVALNGSLMQVQENGGDLVILFDDCNPIGVLLERVSAHKKCDICANS